MKYQLDQEHLETLEKLSQCLIKTLDFAGIFPFTTPTQAAFDSSHPGMPVTLLGSSSAHIIPRIIRKVR